MSSSQSLFLFDIVAPILNRENCKNNYNQVVLTIFQVSSTLFNAKLTWWSVKFTLCWFYDLLNFKLVFRSGGNDFSTLVIHRTFADHLNISQPSHLKKTHPSKFIPKQPISVYVLTWDELAAGMVWLGMGWLGMSCLWDGLPGSLSQYWTRNQ